MNKFTRTKKTELDYEYRFSLINNRFYKETNLDAYNNQNEFAIWLDKIRENLTPSSWRYYRASINYSLFQKTDLLKEILNKKAGKKRKESKNTSRKKRKYITKKEYEEIIAHINKSNSSYKNILYNWVVSGYATGLRPSEWKNVKFNKEDNYLIVLNGKNTNNRSHGKTRTLNISQLNKEQKDAISFMSNTFPHLSEEKYELIFNNCRRLLYVINKKLKKRNTKQNITLYTFRHQFIANTKKVMTPKEVSALSGHKVTRTAQEHYGKKINGENNFNQVKASQKDVNNVIDNSKKFDFSNLNKNKKSTSQLP